MHRVVAPFFRVSPRALRGLVGLFARLAAAVPAERYFQILKFETLLIIRRRGRAA